MTLYRHGLSYSTFALSNLEIFKTPSKDKRNPTPTAKGVLRVKNTGSYDGSQVLQLYISAPESKTQRPVKELHGFEKVFLRAGEEKRVEIDIDSYATSFWDESEGKWCNEKGNYIVSVSSCSEEGAVSVQAILRVEHTRYWLGL